MIEALIVSGFLLVFAFLAVRYMAAQLGVISEDQPDNSPSPFQSTASHQPYARNRESEASSISSRPPDQGLSGLAPSSVTFPELDSDWQPPRPRHTKSSFGLIFSACVLGSLLYVWVQFGSFDAAFQRFFPGRVPPPQPTLIIPQGQDWAEVDGIRWFHLLGTDSAGIGFHGWVPELAFKDNPPEPTPGGKGIMEKIGLPSVAEQVKAAKQLKKMSDELRRQNKRNMDK